MRGETVGRQMEILLVEDSLVDARLTIGALRNGGVQHRLSLVRDGEEALEFLFRRGRFARAPRPDLILLDLLLPKKDGLEVLGEIRADEHLRTIAVVVLSASEDEESQLGAQMLGVDSFITKPVDLDKFLSVVKQLKRYWHSDLILPTVD